MSNKNIEYEIYYETDYGESELQNNKYELVKDNEDEITNNNKYGIKRNINQSYNNNQIYNNNHIYNKHMIII